MKKIHNLLGLILVAGAVSATGQNALINTSNSWSALQLFPANSGFSQSAYGSYEQALWTDSPTGIGITTGNKVCWVNHAITGGPGTAFSSATCTGSNDIYGDSVYDVYLSPATTIGSETWTKHMGMTTQYGVPSVSFPGSLSVGGKVGIGTSNPGATLEVNGSVKLTANSGASMAYQDGTVQSTAWNGVLSGGDYAESVNVTDDQAHYGPGDLIVIDPASPGRFLKSREPYSTAVAGIYSMKPGVRGRRQSADLSQMKDEIPMAMVGIVPTKVNAEGGPIRPSDLLVTSSTPGYAMKGTDRTKMLGAVVGKAMGSLDSGEGVIEVLVTLQ